MKYRINLAVIPVVLGLAASVVAVETATNQAFAGGFGPDLANWNGGYGGSGRNGENIGIGEPPGPA